MRKKRKQKSNSENKIFLLKISQNKNPVRIANYLKTEASKHLVENNFSKLISNPLIKNNILGSTFPISYKDIEIETLVRKGTLEQEIFWNYLIIKHYSKKINLFISKSEQFNMLLLYGMYEEASNKLDEIRNELGLSNWYIENNLLLLSKINGLKEQKDYAEKVREVLPGLTALLTYNFSQKLENELSYEQYDKSLKKMWEDYPDIKDYFELKCNPLNTDTNAASLVNFLYTERESSIIDKYVSLKKALFIIYSNESYCDLSINFLNKYLLKLTTDIQDSELKPLLIKSTNLTYNDLNIDNSNYVKILDLYTIGHYREAYELCLLKLKNNTKLNIDINIIEILIKSEIRCSTNDNLTKISINENSILYNLYECYKSVILKDKNLVSSINKLLKTALELYNAPKNQDNFSKDLISSSVVTLPYIFQIFKINIHRFSIV